MTKTEEMSPASDTAEAGAVDLHDLPELELRPPVAATDPKRAYPIRTAAVVTLLLALVVFGLDQGIQKRTSVNGPDDHSESIAGPAALSASSEPIGGEDKFGQDQYIIVIPLAEDTLRFNPVASTATTELPKPINQDSLPTFSPIDAAQISSPTQVVDDLPTAASEQEMLAAIEMELALTDRDRAVLQRRLWLLGFDPRGVDGHFGPRTRAAIASWQSAHGFPPTGFLDSDQIANINTMSRQLYDEWAASASRAQDTGVSGRALKAADR